MIVADRGMSSERAWGENGYRPDWLPVGRLTLSSIPLKLLLLFGFTIFMCQWLSIHRLVDASTYRITNLKGFMN